MPNHSRHRAVHALAADRLKLTYCGFFVTLVRTVAELER
jgi:hypothetical protein